MAYKRVTPKSTSRRARPLSFGLGAWTDLAQKQCGSDQRYDPTFVFPGLPPGQCVNQAQYDNYHASQPASSSSSSGGFWSDLAAGLASTLKPGTPAAPVVVQGGGGISTTTALAIGGAALLAVVLLTRK